MGTNILQNNVSHGGVVYVAAPGQIPTVRRRSSPVQLAGRAGPPLLGRDADLEQVVSALEPAGTFQVCGPAGAGKTSLLKSVLHGPLAPTAADGVVYHSALTEPVEDTLQSLFEAFYTSDLPFKPTGGDLRNALQPIRALVALDDVSPDGPDRISQVLDAAPNTMILLASSRPLAGAGSSLYLRGLTEEAALSVLERGLGRSLTAQERPPARFIVRALEGQPLRLVQVAGVVRELKRSLPALAREMRSGGGVETLAETNFSSLGDDQRDVLALLAAMDQAPLYVDSVAELTDIAEVEPVVESLLLLALVQAHSPRYSLTAELSEDQHGDLGSDGWRDRILESLPDWAELQHAFVELRAQVAAGAPEESREPALERLGELEEAVTAEEPDVTTMEYVRRWFVKHVPGIAGSVVGLLVNPIVGKLVQVAGDSVAAEFDRRIVRG